MRRPNPWAPFLRPATWIWGTITALTILSALWLVSR